MIQTKNLKKLYTTEEVETTALNNVNLEIKQGEFFLAFINSLLRFNLKLQFMSLLWVLLAVGNRHY